MQAEWEEKFKVRAYDVDFKDRLKVSSAFNYLQDTASAHARDLHVGWEDLQSQGLFWVLSWIKVEFISYPHFEDEIKVKTWPKGLHKLYALRDFLLYDKNNNIICKASSAWLLLNAKSKRITDIKNLQLKFPYQPDVHALTDLPGKFTFENRKDSTHERTVSYTDIDLNLHVNNSKYVEYIINCYPLEFHDQNILKAITMSFISEIKFEDKIEIGINENTGEDNVHFINAENKQNGKQVFQALLEWNKNNFIQTE